jgi:hypothetical protein
VLEQAALQQTAEIVVKQSYRIRIKRATFLQLDEASIHLASGRAMVHDARDDVVYYRPKLAKASGIFTDVELETLWSFVPRRYAICDPVLVFDSEKDGFNLRTLLDRTERAAPVLVVLKARDDAVFGFYSSVPLSPATGVRGRPFGDGEVFLWVLRPSPAKFAWTQANDSFLIADRASLFVGAGGKGFGLVLTEDLRALSNSCATFNNIPLAGPAAVDKEIDCIRVEGYLFE